MKEQHGCGCECHTRSPLERLAELGIPATGLTKVEVRVLGALLPVGRVVALARIERLVWRGESDDPTDPAVLAALAVAGGEGLS